MANLLLSAFADEHSTEFEKQIEYLAQNDIKYIEPRFVDGKGIADLTDEEIERAKEILKNGGVTVSSIGSPLGKINLADDFEAHLQKTRRVLEIANKFGTNLVRVFSFYLPEGKTRSECKDEVIEKLGKMLDIADEYGITMCHENEARIYGESPECCLELLQAFGGRLKAVLDMGNYVLDEYNPLRAYHMTKEYIEYFHIKDALYEGAIVPPGKGNGEIATILDLYKKEADHDAFITLEPHLQTFDGLRKLVGRTFDNPYKFETKEIAFDVAIECIKEILK